MSSYAHIRLYTIITRRFLIRTYYVDIQYLLIYNISVHNVYVKQRMILADTALFFLTFLEIRIVLWIPIWIGRWDSISQMLPRSERMKLLSFQLMPSIEWFCYVQVIRAYFRYIYYSQQNQKANPYIPIAADTRKQFATFTSSQKPTW